MPAVHLSDPQIQAIVAYLPRTYWSIPLIRVLEAELGREAEAAAWKHGPLRGRIT